jgi:preprotein translocase subunit SecB
MELRFSIKQIRLLASHFEFNPSFPLKERENVEIVTDMSIDYKKQRGKIVTVTLSVTSDGKEQPFTFSTVFAGIFKFSEMPDKEDLDRVVNINCAAILLPYVRESIADLTRRASIPPFHLDPINFVSAYKRPEASRKKEVVKPQEQ